MGITNKWAEKLAGEKDENAKVWTRNPNCNLFLSSIEELIKHDEYDPGLFIRRILRRFNLVDEFWQQGIACAMYNPRIRRISIKINPLLLWDVMLRHLASDQHISAEQINAVDRELMAAYKDGGWTQQRFDWWIKFLLSDKVVKHKSGDHSYIVTCFLSVIVHEVLHPTWMHLAKDRQAPDHNIANIAQDFAINQTLDFCAFNKIFMTPWNAHLLVAFADGGAPIIDDEKTQEGKETQKLWKKIFKILKDAKKEEQEPKIPREYLQKVNISQFDDKFLNQPFEYYYSLLIKADDNLMEKTLSCSKMKSGSGSGKPMPCPGCGGSGQAPKPCDSCGGKGCDDCNGSGQKPCEKCDGKGCDDCKDSGHEHDTCPQCNGSGEVRSPSQGNMYDFFEHVLGQNMDDMTDEEKADALEGAMRCGQSDHGIEHFKGFNPATTEMKKVLGNDIKRTVDDMLARGEIKDPSELTRQRPFNLNAAFVNMIEGLYRTDTKDWDRLLKNQIMRCLGFKQWDYTMKREARQAPGMVPGKARLKTFDLIIVMDVSGSINHDDYNRFVNEIEKIAKQVEHPHVRFIQFHSEVSLDIQVPLKKVKEVGIPETGGTVLHKPLDMLESERNKKLVIVFTDGWV
jgi:hypothetical protein